MVFRVASSTDLGFFFRGFLHLLSEIFSGGLSDGTLCKKYDLNRLYTEVKRKYEAMTDCKQNFANLTEFLQFYNSRNALDLKKERF